MDQKKIDRINELARKKKTEGLTPAELEEQAALREEYRAGFRASLTAHLNNTVVMDPDGTKHKVEKKNPLS